MKKDWKNHNKEPVRSAGILTYLVIFDTRARKEQTRKLERPFKYPKALILFVLFVEKIEALGCVVKEVIADAGVDSHEIFMHLASRGTQVVIEVRKDAVITSNKAIDDIVREIKKGRKQWKEKNGYGRRCHVESFFSSFKRWFGEYVSGVKFKNMRRELIR